MQFLKSITFLFGFVCMLSSAGAVDSGILEFKGTYSLNAASGAQAITQNTTSIVEIFKPPINGLSGSLARELECENIGLVTFDLTIKTPANYETLKPHVFHLTLSDDKNRIPVEMLFEIPKTCKTSYRPVPATAFQAHSIYQYTVVFPVRTAAFGPFTGVLWIDSGEGEMSVPVTVTATQSAKQPVLPILYGLNPERDKSYSALVLLFGFMIPFVIGISVWLSITFPKPDKKITVDIEIDVPSSWVSVIATLLPVANTFATIPALTEAGFIYLTSAQHTIITVSYTALWIAGWLIFVITSRPAALAAAPANNKRINWAWLLGLRNALAVSSLSGQLLQVSILLLEAYRSSVLPASSVGLLLTIISILIVLVAIYGTLKGREDVANGSTKALL
jgi:hypothetical protein